MRGFYSPVETALTADMDLWTLTVTAALRAAYNSRDPGGHTNEDQSTLVSADDRRRWAPAPLAFGDNSIELVAQASRALGNRSPDDVAADEGYWRDIQSAFTLDRSLINLNNGNSCPSPTVVHEAYKRYLDYSNQAPVYHRGLIERNIEMVRRRLAAEFGCDTEEMAITRNSSESLQIAQNGLDLEPGDEVRDDRAGLRPHADHVGPARAPRQDQDHEDQLPGADDAARICSRGSKARSRRGPRCCTSATSPT